MIHKPYIATPCYGGVTAKYAKSLAATAYDLGVNRIQAFIDEPMHNFNVPIARNIYVQAFLKTDYDPLVFIDSDMGWSPDQFARLVLSGHEVCCATYPMKTDPFAPAKWVHSNFVGPKVVVDGEEKHLPVVHPRTGFIKVMSSGTGFFAIRRAALEKVIAATPERACMIGDVQAHNLFEVSVIGGQTYTEDTFFCRMWNEMGGEIWCDPQGQLDHVGQFTWRGGLCDTLQTVDTAKLTPVDQQPANPLVSAEDMADFKALMACPPHPENKLRELFADGAC